MRIIERGLDRREGLWAPAGVMLADRLLRLSRTGTVVLHAVNVLALGLLDAARSVVGDTVAVDELLVMLPPIATVVLGWWSYYPIEERLREALQMRVLDTGQPAYPKPSRREYVLFNLRSQVLFSLLPVAAIATWSEFVERVLRFLGSHSGSPGLLGRVGSFVANESTGGLAAVALQLAGVAAVFVAAPAVLVMVWDSVRLGPGPLRERLSAMCASQGVRVRDILVWRTHGTMLNGAVLGLVGRFRYILLTDALLDTLPRPQVEAVMAHEIAHAKHAHLPWLIGATLASGGLAAAVGVETLHALAGLLPERLTIGERGARVGFALELGVLAGIFGIAALAFGFVSRRFEWQADASAARHLSETVRSDEMYPDPAAAPPGRVITQPAAGVMAAALETVARANHIPRERRSWRHGSIGQRQRRLHGLVGRPTDRLPIDQSARRLKLTTLLALGMLVALLARDALLARRPHEGDAGRAAGDATGDAPPAVGP